LYVDGAHSNCHKGDPFFAWRKGVESIQAQQVAGIRDAAGKSREVIEGSFYAETVGNVFAVDIVTEFQAIKGG
jgi:hypothetical protein